MTSPRPIIIDCDPGVDDALAMALALGAPPGSLRLLGITTVAGNVAVESTTRNAGLLLSLMRRHDVPLHAGCARPLMRPVGVRSTVHGEHGLGSAMLAEDPVRPRAAHAVDFLIETIRANPGEIILCPIGPMTNVAMALVKAPDIASMLAGIAFMGGAAFVPGNITPAAEFNMLVDPHAAHIVLTSGVPLTMISLDVTRGVTVSHKRLETVWPARSSTGRALSGMVADYSAGDPALHDPCVIAWLLRPDLFEGVDAHVEIDVTEGLNLGRTVAAVTPRHLAGRLPNCRVITSARSGAVVELIEDALGRLGTAAFSENAR